MFSSDQSIALSLCPGGIGKPIYTRIMNPTTDVFEQRIGRSWERVERSPGFVIALGEGCYLRHHEYRGSGFYEIVSASTLYGGNYNLFLYTLPRYGIKTVFG